MPPRSFQQRVVRVGVIVANALETVVDDRNEHHLVVEVLCRIAVSAGQQCVRRGVGLRIGAVPGPGQRTVALVESDEDRAAAPFPGRAAHDDVDQPEGIVVAAADGVGVGVVAAAARGEGVSEAMQVTALVGDDVGQGRHVPGVRVAAQLVDRHLLGELRRIVPDLGHARERVVLDRVQLAGVLVSGPIGERGARHRDVLQVRAPVLARIDELACEGAPVDAPAMLGRHAWIVCRHGR